jgi:hypothetical protein
MLSGKNFYNKTWTDEQWNNLLFPAIGITLEEYERRKAAMWAAQQAKGAPSFPKSFQEKSLCILIEETDTVDTEKFKRQIEIMRNFKRKKNRKKK